MKPYQAKSNVNVISIFISMFLLPCRRICWILRFLLSLFHLSLQEKFDSLVRVAPICGRFTVPLLPLYSRPCSLSRVGVPDGDDEMDGWMDEVKGWRYGWWWWPSRKWQIRWRKTGILLLYSSTLYSILTSLSLLHCIMTACYCGVGSAVWM